MTVIVFVCLVSTDWIVLHFSFWNALYSFSSNGNNIPKIPIIRQWLYSDHFLKQLWNSYAETIFCCCWSACECQHSENPPRPMCDRVFPPGSTPPWWATPRATCARCAAACWAPRGLWAATSSSTQRTASPTAPCAGHASPTWTTSTGPPLTSEQPPPPN